MNHGAIVGVDTPVVDLEAAADFYAAVFGWSFEPHTATRWQFTTGTSGAMGAITTSRRPSSEGVLFCVAVDSIDDALARATAHGGRIEEERYPSDVGDLATIRDPSGNWIGLFETHLTRRSRTNRDGTSSAEGA
jgi:predicted enzyme related to lactoylglutathione lyase